MQNIKKVHQKENNKQKKDKQLEHQGTPPETDHPTEKESLPEETAESPAKKEGHKRVQVRKSFKRQVTLKSSSPDGIDPEKISVNLRTRDKERNKSSPGSNQIALSSLWAHYLAGQLGLLEPDKPPPWDYNQETPELDDDKLKNVKLGRRPWRRFLSIMIKDRHWVEWFKIPEEVKSRTLNALAPG